MMLLRMVYVGGKPTMLDLNDQNQTKDDDNRCLLKFGAEIMKCWVVAIPFQGNGLQ